MDGEHESIFRGGYYFWYDGIIYFEYILSVGDGGSIESIKYLISKPKRNNDNNDEWYYSTCDSFVLIFFLESNHLWTIEEITHL